MRVIIAAFILTLSLNAFSQATCTNCQRSNPEIVGTPVVENGLEGLDSAMIKELGVDLCRYLDEKQFNNLFSMFKDLAADGEISFISIYRQARCGATKLKSALWSAIDASGAKNDLNYVKLIMGTLYKEDPVFLKVQLNTPLASGKSLAVYVMEGLEQARAIAQQEAQATGSKVENNRAVRVWTEIYNLVITYS